MATNLQFAPEQINKIFGTVIKNSALMSLVTPIVTRKENDKVAVASNWTPARVHTPGVADKVVDDDQLQTFDVLMTSFYKLLLVDDYQAEDEPELVLYVIEQLKSVVASTLDKAIFPGLVADSNAELPFETRTVDGTAASWLAVIDEIASNGFAATGMILDLSLRGPLTSALIENTASNGLQARLEDGIDVAGVRVYFRQGLGGKGVIFDAAQLAVAIKSGSVKGEWHRASEDWTLRKANSDGVYAGFRIGVGVSSADAGFFVELEAEDETP